MGLSEAEELELLELENENALAVNGRSSSLPSIPRSKSAALGAGQGITLGFADEGAGAIAGAGRDIMSGKFPTFKSYRESRDSFRKGFKEAELANPKSYLAGEFAGGAATALVPGFQGATLPKLAAIGAAQGLGSSEADLIEGDFGGAAADIGIGAATGATLGKVLPPVVRNVGKGLGWSGKKLFSSILGPSEEAVSAYLKNPAAIKSASMEGVAESMPQVANKFNEVIKGFADKAQKTLSKSKFIQPSDTDPGGAFTKDEIFGVVKNARRKLGGVYTDESRSAAKTLERISANLNKKQNTVSQKEVDDLIEMLDEEIPWDKLTNPLDKFTTSEQALINVRKGLSNSLKSKNKAYGEAMKPLEEAIDSRNEFLRKFSVKRVKGEGFVPSDTTYSRTNTALKEGKIETDRIIENTKRITGIDLTPRVKNAKFAQEFRGGRTNGSRNVNTMAVLGGGTGAAIGAGLGLPPIVGGGAGTMAGAAAGSYIDKKGGEIAANLLDKYLSSKQVAGNVGSYVSKKMPAILKTNPAILGKYGPLLKRASQLGAQQVALQHWLLMDSDPEYQAIVEELESQK